MIGSQLHSALRNTCSGGGEGLVVIILLMLFLTILHGFCFVAFCINTCRLVELPPKQTDCFQEEFELELWCVGIGKLKCVILMKPFLFQLHQMKCRIRIRVKEKGTEAAWEKNQCFLSTEKISHFYCEHWVSSHLLFRRISVSLLWKIALIYLTDATWLGFITSIEFLEIKKKNPFSIYANTKLEFESNLL